MEKYRAIPHGYMTAGEVAKKMGVTVRTMQYYDKEGLLLPSSESEGGRRLYTNKDVIKLHHILSMKHLGFSLDEIKNNMSSLDTPDEIAQVLTEQAATIRKKMEDLSIALKEIETLKEEVLKMQQVDFKKYADIIVNLQMKNEYYWMIKHMDDSLLDNFRNRFDMNSSREIMEKYTSLNNEAIRLQKEGVLPEGEEGQEFAKAFWNMILEFTDGDMSLLPKLMETGNFDGQDIEREQKLAIANSFIEPALGAYFTALDYNPLEEELK